MNISSTTTEVEALYPLVFDPILMEKPWAGNLLKSAPEGIGEVWTVVDRPSQQSIVSNGRSQGKSLKELLEFDPESILGKGKFSQEFPVLVKLIDAGQRLSVQVHPCEDGPLGSQPKSEMWYILKASEDAEVYVGFNDDYQLAQIEKSLNKGTLVEMLNLTRPEEGDSYFIPAGTVHALGAGNLVLEIQQNSDSTYRLYDWGRVDDLGAQRELHILEGLASIKAVRYTKGANWEIRQPSFSLKEILDTHWATVYEISGNYLLNCRHESCFIVSAVEATEIDYRGALVSLSQGASSLIPASLNGVRINGEKWLLTKVK